MGATILNYYITGTIFTCAETLMIDRIGDRKIKEIEVARAFSQKNVQGVYPRS